MISRYIRNNRKGNRMKREMMGMKGRKYKIEVEAVDLPEGEEIYEMNLNGPVLIHKGIDPDTSPYFRRVMESNGMISKHKTYIPPRGIGDAVPIPLFGREELQIIGPQDDEVDTGDDSC